jgi:hypothetical protein
MSYNMNKIFTILFLILCSLSVSAQQFSQYNTGTLYDSFENPSQRAFIPDSSRQIAFNFFVPNFDANFYITGHIQRPLKSRAFGNPPSYNTSSLRIGQNALNHFNVNGNAYAVMLKFFSSLNGNVEMGFSAQTRIESKGLVTDESVAFLDGPSNFAYNNYDNIFNDHYMVQMYDQLGFTYREQVAKQLSIGFKLSYLSGIQYNKIDVDQSSLQINRDPVDPNNDNADVYMRGKYYRSYVPGRLDGRDFLPTLRNPGASISMGATFRTEDGIFIQGTIKDLGFIHWNKRSTITDFDNTTHIEDITSEHREKNIYNAVYDLFRGNGQVTAFNTKTNAKAELSVSKSYWLDDDKTFRYFPTIVAQKEMFYSGFTGALVNSVQKNNLIATLTATYDDYKLFNIGAQIMVKSANAEFFIGSERLTNTGRFTLAALNNGTQINRIGNYTGADIFLGFSLKFGRVIEHPMNSSYIPMGEKGFFGRLFGRIFKTNN